MLLSFKSSRPSPITARMHFFNYVIVFIASHCRPTTTTRPHKIKSPSNDMTYVSCLSIIQSHTSTATKIASTSKMKQSIIVAVVFFSAVTLGNYGIETFWILFHIFFGCFASVRTVQSFFFVDLINWDTI